MTYNKKTAWLLAIAWGLMLLLVFTLEGCRTVKHSSVAEERNAVAILDERHSQNIDYTIVDSILKRWSISAEDFEATISIPIPEASATEYMPERACPSDTNSAYPPRFTHPMLSVSVKARALNADGEQHRQVETQVADSSDMTRRAASRESTAREDRKKTTRLPAYFCWAAVPFFLFLIYILYRWLKRG